MFPVDGTLIWRIIMSVERLKVLICMSKGETWDDKVIRFAEETGRSRSSIYRWLSIGPPSLILDGLEYRLTRPTPITPSEEVKE